MVIWPNPRVISHCIPVFVCLANSFRWMAERGRSLCLIAPSILFFVFAAGCPLTGVLRDPVLFQTDRHLRPFPRLGSPGPLCILCVLCVFASLPYVVRVCLSCPASCCSCSLSLLPPLSEYFDFFFVGCTTGAMFSSSTVWLERKLTKNFFWLRWRHLFFVFQCDCRVCFRLLAGRFVTKSGMLIFSFWFVARPKCRRQVPNLFLLLLLCGWLVAPPTLPLYSAGPL